MERTLHRNQRVTGRVVLISFSKGLGWGFLGGLFGTMIMDLVLMRALSAVGLPVLTCFSIVGSTVAGLFLMQSVEMAYTIQLGVITHYLVGPLFGAVFGMLVARIEALQVNTLKKSILLAIIFIEILSQPMLAVTPILLKMTIPAILQWYSGAFIMHMFMAVVLGSVVGYGLGSAPLIKQPRTQSKS